MGSLMADWLIFLAIVIVLCGGAELIWGGLPGAGGGLKQIHQSPTILDTSPGALGLRTIPVNGTTAP
jgi:hypothetical protein